VAREVTYSAARRHLAMLLDEVTTQGTTVIITRRQGAAAALISATELAELEETAHHLRSPANRKRLLTALDRALANSTPSTTIAALREEVGLTDSATTTSNPLY
jgi:antitoxin YefM